jgi:D-alanyl-D-alanine carboxypeptidase
MKNYCFVSRACLLVSLIVLMGNSCNTTSNRDEALFQSYLNAELDDNTPGILVNITSPDKDIQWSGAAGFSDMMEKTELRPDQTFRIASVTKTFVAATVLRLWEDDKIHLDDPISKYISQDHTDLLIEGGYHPDAITVRHLLMHTGGLSCHTNSSKYTFEFLKNRHVWTRTEQINDMVKDTRPVGEAGAQFTYSDTGYVLLGEIIENVTGHSMGGAILEQLHLKKLGINDTYIEEIEGDFSGKRIHQYIDNDDSYQFHPSFDYFGGGGLLSTASDLSRFYLSLFNHQVFHRKETLDTMLTAFPSRNEHDMDYRMGIWKIDLDGMAAFTHTGFWGTQVVYIPEINTAISANYSQRWTEGSMAPVILKILNSIR